VHVEFAENGREGVQMATQGNYDLVLMDMQMPVMDGYETALLLKGHADCPPIVALTANAMRTDR